MNPQEACELTIEVCEKVMGWKKIEYSQPYHAPMSENTFCVVDNACYESINGFIVPWKLFDPLMSENDVFRVMERIQEIWRERSKTEKRDGDGIWKTEERPRGWEVRCEFPSHPWMDHGGIFPTLKEAICRVAVKEIWWYTNSDLNTDRKMRMT